MDRKIELGSVVFSKMGRDKNAYYIVVDILDENTVFICDGEIRKLSNPKKKSVKHLRPNGVVLESIAEKIKEHKKIFDSEVKSSLRSFNEPLQNNGGENVKK